jgi:hypothetical protein
LAIAIKVAHTHVNIVRDVLRANVRHLVGRPAVGPLVPSIPPFVTGDHWGRLVSCLYVNQLTFIYLPGEVLTGSLHAPLPNNTIAVAGICHIKTVDTLVKGVKRSCRRADVEGDLVVPRESTQPNQHADLHEVLVHRNEFNIRLFGEPEY